MLIRLASLLVGITITVPIAVGQQVRPPVLVSEPTSTRAIALETPALLPQPFDLTSPVQWNPDRRTRIMLFVLGLTLQPGEGLSSLKAEAEDGAGRHYDLIVEDYRKIPDRDWLGQIVLRLNDDLADAGDCLIKVSYRDTPSNRVRVGIGHVGGGPPDDAGALPTPAPPYTITGRITLDGAAAAGFNVTLTGTQPATTTTNAQGFYSFIVDSVGDYAVSLPGPYVFTPSAATFNNLSGNRSADFATASATISGQVKSDEGNLLSEVTVMLSGPVSRTAITGSDGGFSFPQLPAFQSYTIRPNASELFEYSPQTIQLSANTSIVFNAIRRTYTISGTVRNGFGMRLPGVSVRLTGPVVRETTTDVVGDYSFPSLPVGNWYQVSANSIDFFFSPEAHDIYLLGAQIADFQGTPAFVLSGHVREMNAQPIFGVVMSLAGAQTATTTTDANGHYLFKVRQGTYSVTPSFQQVFYNFQPFRQTLNVSTHRAADFLGTFSPITSPSSVLEFDGTAMAVDHGPFWPGLVNLGHFFWESWIMPGENNDAKYLLSDGYGGAHALLFGFNSSSDPGHYSLFGNVWTGSGAVYFISDEGPAPGEWGHCAVGWDGTNIITYFNGVPVGKVPFSGPRQTLTGSDGSGRLFIGGSDHQNLTGRIAQVRGYDGTNPRETAPEATFTPQTLFSREGNFLSYYMRPSSTIADLTPVGYRGIPHPGKLRGLLFGGPVDCPTCPVPKFVFDPTAPDFSNPNNPGQITAPAPSPGSPPPGALVFDSFSRTNSTYVLSGVGGLGSTEAGSAGQLNWQMSPETAGRKPFGILNGRAVLLADSKSVAWIATPTTNLDLRVNSRPGAWGSGRNTGIAFRVADPDNHFFAYTSFDHAGIQRLTVGYYQNGIRAEFTNNPELPSSFTTLRVVTLNDGRIDVYADGILLYTMSTAFMANVSSAGLYNNAAGMALTNRWDNFTVFAATQ
jgi:hypothetical protein